MRTSSTENQSNSLANADTHSCCIALINPYSAAKSVIRCIISLAIDVLLVAVAVKLLTPVARLILRLWYGTPDRVMEPPEFKRRTILVDEKLK